VFFEQLAKDAGFRIEWQRMNPERNVEASVTIMRGNAEPMRAMLDDLIPEDR
jgi:hypothetical protein